jgi:hypothetical protein
VFILIFVVLLFAVVGGTFYVMSQASFKLSPHKHILVLGASRSGWAIDDAIYTSAENVSQGSESNLYAYCKLRKFLEENSHIDTVILSVQYASQLKTADRFLFDEEYLSKISHHLTLLKKDEVDIFLKERKELMVKAILQLLINNNYRCVFKFILNKDISYRDLDIGGYVWTSDNHLQKDIASHQLISEVETEDTISELQKDYLLKMSDLCALKNITFILISVPTYKPELYDYPSSRLVDYCNHWLNGVTYLDYSARSLPDSCYRDVYHLNAMGAQIFSEYLKENFANDVRKYESGQ